jgi:ABC-2 type transport system ATP-binding protein
VATYAQVIRPQETRVSGLRNPLPAVRRWSGRTQIAVVGVLVLMVGLVTWSVLAPSGRSGFRAEQLTVGSGSGADEVQLDTTVFIPDGVHESAPAAAVVLAHGFGGSQASMLEDARVLAGQGYVVLTYSARGFGRSSGQIGLNSPDFEVADASVLLDLLAQRP